MKRIKASFLTAFVLAVALATAFAIEVPFLSGRINDNANLLSPAAEQRLESMLKAYEDSTTNQIVVLTIASLEGETIEDYSMKVAETWKLGKKGVDNGALLIVAKDDRKLRIEVGYGLEGSLTDAATSYIINSIILPKFKDGNFEEGIEGGVDAIIRAADGDLDTTEASAEMGIGELLIFLIIFGGIVSVFTFIGVMMDGCMSWFMYVFLMVFWAGIAAFIGDVSTFLAYLVFGAYLIGYPVLKILIAKSPAGKIWKTKFKTSTSRGGFFATTGGGWSSGSGGWSSGGGSSFSGGGGSFGGGGSSGSW